ncbi:hypothetical protein R3I94_004992 [Phoxinus phoxinus]
MPTSSLQAALIVSATGTGNCSTSIILQAVCDHQGRFIDTYVGWIGSVHDARVLRYSPLYRRSMYPPPEHFILADGGYPCLRHPLPLITPYKRPVPGHHSLGLGLGHHKIMALEDEHEEDEGEHVLETVSGAPWRH